MWVLNLKKCPSSLPVSHTEEGFSLSSQVHCLGSHVLSILQTTLLLRTMFLLYWQECLFSKPGAGGSTPAQSPQCGGLSPWLPFCDGPEALTGVWSGVGMGLFSSLPVSWDPPLVRSFLLDLAEVKAKTEQNKIKPKPTKEASKNQNKTEADRRDYLKKHLLGIWANFPSPPISIFSSSHGFSLLFSHEIIYIHITQGGGIKMKPPRPVLS